jgi:hypothetical protein
LVAQEVAVVAQRERLAALALELAVAQILVLRLAAQDAAVQL